MTRPTHTARHLRRFGLSLALCAITGAAILAGAIHAILRSTP